jgi:hypothetical protein
MVVQRWFTRATREEYTEARREKNKMHKKRGSIMKNSLSG